MLYNLQRSTDKLKAIGLIFWRECSFLLLDGQGDLFCDAATLASLWVAEAARCTMLTLATQVRRVHGILPAFLTFEGTTEPV